MSIAITNSRVSNASAEKASDYLRLEPVPPSNTRHNGFFAPEKYDLSKTFKPEHIISINELTAALEDGKLVGAEHPAVQAGLKALAQVHANMASVRKLVLQEAQPGSRHVQPEYFSDAKGNDRVKKVLNKAPNKELLLAAVEQLDRAIWTALRNTKSALTDSERSRLFQISLANESSAWMPGAFSSPIEFILGNLKSGTPFLPKGD